MRIRYPSRPRAGMLVAALAAGWLQIAAPMVATAALPTVDFGNVNVGDSLTLDQQLPLTYALSQIPAGTVLYSGGDPTVDFLAAQLGLTVPITSDELYGVIGEVTATYRITLTMMTGVDFSASSLDCATGIASCTASVTFLPTAGGIRNDVVRVHLADVNVTGSSTYASLIDLMAPFLVPQIEPQLDVPVSGYGATPNGGLQLRVTVPREAAPCVLLDATSIDFGTLPFSTEAALSEGAANVAVSSCSTGSQALYASGTDANGSGASPAHWTLSSVGGNPCGIGVNQYGVALGTDGSGGMPASFQLSTLAGSWIVMTAGANVASSVDYQMPCVGSDGAGQTMSSQVTFLATVP
ncbi:MAG TPA: hypothetical protein VF013_08995 [Candidatus Limnocylindria bacterium]